MMRLEHHGVDTYVGVGPAYPWGGLYGGQIVAQALRACGNTVEPHHLPHSLHAYFIRPGDSSEPIRFEVDRLRNGRSFVTRQVVARQSGGAILTMIASFHVEEDETSQQVVAMPPVPPPDDLDRDTWSPMFERAVIERDPDTRRQRAWLRIAGHLEDDPVLHACALAYMSDDLPTESLVMIHPAWRPDRDSELEEEWGFMSASLDHAVWFHRRARADDWHLEDFVPGGLSSARGLTTGNLYSFDGTHIATVSQEVLLRQRRSR